ncbi:Dps family protein [Saprospira grandis]|uniref:Dps family protein n=1 Tax=Saprospira grandis TaxID=1008 RepID=UPI0022DDAC9A|nr:Dps family protein [Saprospira grandis]WBM74393.1 DNA starvation/stationary phase protection protein [Saprospira grandis]
MMKKQTTTIGLDHAESQQLAEKLNVLLANYQLLYINTRGFHWNIKGDNFFELHAKFEEIYSDLQIKIDEIAERILTLGQQPLHAYSQYLEQSSIEEITNVTDGKEGLAHVLKAFSVIIELERELLGLSDEANDEGTNALMSDYIREQEKLAWMYNAYLG